ncbi:MAG: hypothetical protein M1433_02865 [Candidatus Parvarchaeota archaeon]|nr:hypothetical protein [Candidatus Parvarchaeota archaeon]
MEAKNECHVCGREMYFYSEYLKSGLCAKHFEKMLVRRVRSAIISEGFRDRTFKIIKNDSAASRFLGLVFMEDDKSDLTLDTNTVEDFSAEVLEYFTLGTKPPAKVSHGNVFNPLYLTSEKEIIAFLKLKGVEGREKHRSEMDAYLLSIAETVEKRRPGAMISSVKIGREMDII